MARGIVAGQEQPDRVTDLPSRRQTPQVSVLTPSYNYGRFIADSLRSVRQQPGLVTEHIVQDGDSTDETVKVLSEFGDEVKWWSQPDQGQSNALNKALVNARSEWISWLNADEFYFPFGLRLLRDVAIREGADVVYGDTVYVDGDGRFLRLVPYHFFSAFLLRSYGPYVNSCSTLFRREALGLSPWDEDLEVAMDWDLYMRLLANGARFVYVPFPVGVFREHGEEITARPMSEFSAEFRELAARHRVWSVKGRRRLARWPHDIAKLVSGSYPRQLRARRFYGHDLRWFQSPEAAKTCMSMLQVCYPRTVNESLQLSFNAFSNTI